MQPQLRISTEDGRPMYRQLVEQVRQKIAMGDWPAGQELPSMRRLADDLEVSLITVRRAYMELEREGLIVSRQGRGTFVTDDAQLARRLQREELEHHLAEAVKRARFLGVELSELLEMVRRVRARSI